MHSILIGELDAPLFVFDSDSIESIHYLANVAVAGDELAIDTFEAEIAADISWDFLLSTTDFDGLETSDGYVLSLSYNSGDLRLMPYGTKLFYYRDGVLQGKYYVKSVTRTSKTGYTVEAMSAVGLFDSQQHLGGIYTGQTFAAVVADIIGGVVPYSIEVDLASEQVFNWLPIATKRQNLHQLMFAMGATLTKDANGDVVFSYLYDGGAVTVPDARVYYEGEVEYTAPVTRVEVTEHSWQYVGNEEAKTLFDNTDGSGVANQLFVAFSDAPVYVASLATTGTLTIDAADVNYAIVSGTGKLTGQPYTHTEHIIAADINTTAAENVATITDATLVSTLNSQNVVDRLLSYYSSARAISSSIVLDGEQCGRQIALNDPFGEASTAFIASMSVNASNIDKAECELIADYVPTGHGNKYDSAEVLTGAGTWTVPDGVTQIKAVIIGGGQGGYCGHNGADGENGGVNSQGSGGGGGTSGNGGQGGKVLTVTIAVSGGATLSYTCGTGGAGGVATALNDEVAGALGTDTTFDLYSSASGAVSAGGYLNVFTGEIYGASGLADGAVGSSGGAGAADGNDYIPTSNTGGFRGADGLYQSDICYGGGGGGAAYGADGNDGNDGWFEIGANYVTAHGGAGGVGGHPTARAQKAVYGCGGDGCHSGGGGGGGGSITRSYDVFSHGGAGGAGGLGGDGGQGGNGCVVVFY